MKKEKPPVSIKITLPAMLIWFLFALTFCGDPDLHDALIDRVQMSESE